MSWQQTLLQENDMTQPTEKQHLFDKPRNVSLLIGTLYAICALLFILDFFLHRHVIHGWDSIIGFYAIFGFAAYVIIVQTAKLLRKLVERKEDYYDVDD
jgi:hypothetical protein